VAADAGQLKSCQCSPAGFRLDSLQGSFLFFCGKTTPNTKRLNAESDRSRHFSLCGHFPQCFRHFLVSTPTRRYLAIPRKTTAPPKETLRSVPAPFFRQLQPASGSSADRGSVVCLTTPRVEELRTPESTKRPHRPVVGIRRHCLEYLATGHVGRAKLRLSRMPSTITAPICVSRQKYKQSLTALARKRRLGGSLARPNLRPVRIREHSRLPAPVDHARLRIPGLARAGNCENSFSPPRVAE